MDDAEGKRRRPSRMPKPLPHPDEPEFCACPLTTDRQGPIEASAFLRLVMAVAGARSRRRIYWPGGELNEMAPSADRRSTASPASRIFDGRPSCSYGQSPVTSRRAGDGAVNYIMAGREAVLHSADALRACVKRQSPTMIKTAETLAKIALTHARRAVVTPVGIPKQAGLGPRSRCRARCPTRACIRRSRNGASLHR